MFALALALPALVLFHRSRLPVLAALILVAPIAAAQTITPPDVGEIVTAAFTDLSAKNWVALAAVLLPVLAWLVRRFLPASHFVHTAIGGVVLSVVPGILDAVAQSLTSGFHLNAVVSAVLTTVLSSLAVSNPSTRAAVSVAP
jgi:hypothetical protein